jgi:hypothetical protein
LTSAFVSAAAGATDYGLLRRRLRLGWEVFLPKLSGAAGFGALAVGLGLGGLITRQISQR